MGIRIHKAIGYGLTDLKTERRKDDDDDCVIVDPRLNPRGILGNPDAIEKKCFSFDRYLDFLDKFEWTTPGYPLERRRNRETADLENFQLKANEYFVKKCLAEVKSHFHRTVVHDPEGGLSNVVLITPASQLLEWQRYDSSIDWCEETNVNPDLSPRVLELKQPPYPWNDNREDLKTGKRIGDSWRLVEHNYAKKPGKDWRWIVPAEVAAVCKFFKLFKDDETIRTLKPLLYVWWS